MFSRLRKKESSFVVYREEDETPIHVFKNCNGVKLLAFASKWGLRLDQYMEPVTGSISKGLTKPFKHLRFDKWLCGLWLQLLV